MGVAEEVNFAVTDSAAFRSTMHVDLPLHAPDQPANLAPDPGVAVSLTDVPLAKLALQVNPQLTPEGLLVIVPAPVPALSTVSSTGGIVEVNVAVTEVAEMRLTVQVEIPLQAPVHPVNVEPELGAADNATGVPVGKLARHVVPQLIPKGLLVTVPLPVPALRTTRSRGVIVKLNSAIVVALDFRVKAQLVVPPQAPNHPPNLEVELGVAVSLTTVPLGKLAVQLVGQLMPAGVLVTVPAPVPAICTESWNVVGAELADEVNENDAPRTKQRRPAKILWFVMMSPKPQVWSRFDPGFGDATRALVQFEHTTTTPGRGFGRDSTAQLPKAGICCTHQTTRYSISLWNGNIRVV